MKYNKLVYLSYYISKYSKYKEKKVLNQIRELFFLFSSRLCNGTLHYNPISVLNLLHFFSVQRSTFHTFLERQISLCNNRCTQVVVILLLMSFSLTLFLFNDSSFFSSFIFNLLFFSSCFLLRFLKAYLKQLLIYGNSPLHPLSENIIIYQSHSFCRFLLNVTTMSINQSIVYRCSWKYQL